MEQVDLSFMEAGIKNIQQHVITFAIILVFSAVVSLIIAKLFNFPAWLSNAFTIGVVLVVFVLTALFYYLPGIINGFA